MSGLNLSLQVARCGQSTTTTSKTPHALPAPLPSGQGCEHDWNARRCRIHIDAACLIALRMRQ
jgi:hypothetical protein